MYEDKGDLTEFNISSGARYTFLKSRRFFLKPFLESGLYYRKSSYEDNFSGGFDGQGIILDDSFNTYGISGRAGLLFQLISKMSISISSSIKCGRETRENKIHRSEEKRGGGSITMPEISLGYRF